MALATRPKPKVQHKKRAARHHRHSKVYLKTYWPYLPMLAIVGAGVYANSHWPAGLDNLSAGLSNADPSITRIEVMVGDQNTWGLTIILLMATIAAGIFIFQHWYRIQRALNKGERYIVKHPWFDIILVLICTAGVVLSRSYFNS